VEPTGFVVPEGGSSLRDDRVAPSLSKEDVLCNAPREKKGFFAVPKVIS
jgi:aspartyl/glutamyl-tRNA(Asn/Gln) amidotransferase C subunit